ncbi:hypothetical protein Btru_057510 [Bulinus truncatus]|nr:hypothetical protein Btru_057510 [Bulinus truncatus]
MFLKREALSVILCCYFLGKILLGESFEFSLREDEIYIDLNDTFYTLLTDCIGNTSITSCEFKSDSFVHLPGLCKVKTKVTSGQHIMAGYSDMPAGRKSCQVSLVFHRPIYYFIFSISCGPDVCQGSSFLTSKMVYTDSRLTGVQICFERQILCNATAGGALFSSSLVEYSALGNIPSMNYSSGITDFSSLVDTSISPETTVLHITPSLTYSSGNTDFSSLVDTLISPETSVLHIAPSATYSSGVPGFTAFETSMSFYPRNSTVENWMTEYLSTSSIVGARAVLSADTPLLDLTRTITGSVIHTLESFTPAHEVTPLTGTTIEMATSIEPSSYSVESDTSIEASSYSVASDTSVTAKSDFTSESRDSFDTTALTYLPTTLASNLLTDSSPASYGAFGTASYTSQASTSVQTAQSVSDTLPVVTSVTIYSGETFSSLVSQTTYVSYTVSTDSSIIFSREPPIFDSWFTNYPIETPSLSTARITHISEIPSLTTSWLTPNSETLSHFTSGTNHISEISFTDTARITFSNETPSSYTVSTYISDTTSSYPMSTYISDTPSSYTMSTYISDAPSSYTMSTKHINDTPSSYAMSTFIGNTPSSYTMSTKHISDTPSRYTMSTYISDTPSSYTMSTKHISDTPSSYTISTHISDTPSSYTMSTKHISNTLSSYTMSTHISDTPSSYTMSTDISDTPSSFTMSIIISQTSVTTTQTTPSPCCNSSARYDVTTTTTSPTTSSKCDVVCIIVATLSSTAFITIVTLGLCYVFRKRVLSEESILSTS